MDISQQKNAIHRLILEFLENPTIQAEYQDSHETAKTLLDQLENQEFRITVVGEFSAGKSTFLNALLGKDVLLHGLNETTAALTYIHCVPSSHKKASKIEVCFFDETRPPEIYEISQSDKLKEFTTTYSDRNVIGEVHSVHIYQHFPEITEKVVFVDTPGLNGNADGHRELTMNEIRRAHASICLFQLRGLTDTEKPFIEHLTTYQKKTIFVLNGIDQLKESEGISCEERIEVFRKQLLDELGDCIDPNPSVFGVSALKALVARDATIRTIHDGEPDLTPEERRQCLPDSRFVDFENYLWHTVVKEESEHILKDSVCARFSQLLEDLENDLSEVLAIYFAPISDKTEKEASERLAKFDATTENNLEKITNFIQSQRRQLTKDLPDILRPRFGKIRDELSADLERIKSYKALDSENYERKLNQEFTNCRMEIQNLLMQSLEGIYQQSILEAKRFSAEINIEADGKIKFKELREIQVNDGGLKTKKTKNIEEKIKVNTLKKETEEQKVKAEKELASLNVQIVAEERKVSSVEAERQRKLASLGEMPDIERRSYPQETHEETGFIEDVIHFFTFDLFREPKKHPKAEIFKDSSARDAWIEKEQRIRSDYARKIERIRGPKQVLENRKEALEKAHSHSSTQYNILCNKSADLDKNLARIEKDRDEIYAKAEAEALKNAKKQILRQITDYLSEEGSLWSSLEESIQTNIKANIEQIIKETGKRFKTSRTKSKKQLLSILDQKAHEQEHSEQAKKQATTELLLNQIKSLKHKI